jgi:hypothetical protein
MLLSSDGTPNARANLEQEFGRGSAGLEGKRLDVAHAGLLYPPSAGMHPKLMVGGNAPESLIEARPQVVWRLTCDIRG